MTDCICGKELATPRPNETGYRFCSQECKKIGLEKEREIIGAKSQVLGNEISRMNNEIRVLEQSNRKLSHRMTQIGWTLQDNTKKSLIREVADLEIYDKLP